MLSCWTRTLLCGLAVALIAPFGTADEPTPPDAVQPAQDQPDEELAEQLSDPGAILADPTEPAEPEEAPGELQGSVSLPEDPALRRRLARAVRLIENGRAADAAQALGRLAESVGDADAFVRVEGQGRSLRSVKAEVQRLIGELPPGGRQAYEATFGPAARRMLDESPADAGVTRRVATLYPHTAAGGDALHRLASTYRDGGAYAEAAACLERLRTIDPAAAARHEPHLSLELATCRLHCGDRAGAESILAELSRRQTGPVFLAGEPVPTIPSIDPLAKSTLATSGSPLAYTPHPADADVPTAVTGDPLLAPRWTVETTADAAEIESAGRRLGATIPAFVPSVVGGLVLRPTTGGFVAHDLATGELLWRYPSDGDATTSGEGVWTDLAHGRLSTDGRSAFLVETEDRAAAPAVTAAAPAQFAQGGFFPAAPAVMVNAAVMVVADESAAPPSGPSSNVLTALDVTPPRQGNRLWRVGGVTGGDEPRLAGHFLLGPPLAAHGRLYAVTEQEQTVRLVVLDAATGRLDWSLDLGHAEVPISADPQRQRIGATPTLSRNVLLCPSAGGTIVAVDLVGRSLFWGFRFPRSAPPNAPGDDPFSDVSPGATPGWADGTIRVVGDRVLATPPESDQLDCLDLHTGQVLWQRGREEGLLAEPIGERTVVVARSGVTLLDLKDGSPVGTPVLFPAGTSPSGRGFVAGGVYAQPLSDGSLIRVSAADGSSDVSRPAGGIDLGNLIWHQGTMLSLGPGFLRAFDDRDRLAVHVADTLRSRPADATALLRRADLHAEAGRHAEVIADCRRAYEAEPTPRTRNRLIATLLDGVRVGLPDAAAYDAELDRLAEAR